MLSGKFYCYYTCIFVLPASVEVTREAVAAVEMNTSGQNDENIKIIYFYCVCVYYNQYYDTLYSLYSTY